MQVLCTLNISAIFSQFLAGALLLFRAICHTSYVHVSVMNLLPIIRIPSIKSSVITATDPKDRDNFSMSPCHYFTLYMPYMGKNEAFADFEDVSPLFTSGTAINCCWCYCRLTCLHVASNVITCHGYAKPFK